jgi:hypothetical protein
MVRVNFFKYNNILPKKYIKEALKYYRRHDSTFSNNKFKCSILSVPFYPLTTLFFKIILLLRNQVVNILV